MAWSEQRPDKSRMYVNKLCMLVGPCPAFPTWPDEYSHISAKLCMYCLKLSGHTGRHDRSRQDVVYLYKCVHKMPGLVRPYRPSRQVRTTCRDRPRTGSPRFLYRPCRAIKYYVVTNELFCRYQIKQKQLTKSFMMILNNNKNFGLHDLYKNTSAVKGLKITRSYR